MTTKPKGEHVATYVFDLNESDTADAVRRVRDDYEGFSVRTYRRTVSADGVALSVTVVIVRRPA